MENTPTPHIARGALVYYGLVQFIVHIPEKVSLNQALRKHHKAVNALKQEWHMAVYDAQPPKWTGNFPVDVRYTYRMHGKAMDSTNAVFMGKALEDALVEYGVIPGDDPKYVRWSCHMTEQSEENEVLVQITASQASPLPLA